MTCNSPFSLGGHVEPQENKKLRFCTVSLKLKLLSSFFPVVLFITLQNVCGVGFFFSECIISEIVAIQMQATYSYNFPLLLQLLKVRFPLPDVYVQFLENYKRSTCFSVYRLICQVPCCEACQPFLILKPMKMFSMPV